MSVNIITYTGRTRTAQHDAMTYDAAIGQSGILYGCEITATGNTLTVGGGFGIIKGRVFQIEEEAITVPLTSSGSQSKCLVLTLDLSNSEHPLALAVQSGDYTLTQDADANFDTGIYQIKLATFTVTSVEITDVYMTYDRVHGGISVVNVTDTSLDQFVDPGNYYFSIAYAPTDAPAGANGWLIVLGGGAKKQIWIREGSENTQSDVCVRSFTSGAWTSWRRLVSENEMYYMPGQQTGLRINCGGYITNGRTYCGGFIPLLKPIHSSVKSVTVVNNTDYKVTIRQNNAYLVNEVNPVSLGATCAIRANGLDLNLTKSSGFGGINNSPVSIVGYIQVRFN
ncbi:MAG: hypothetical protein IKE94_16805 [Aeriscardovia sp.]|nr:hypothetical protein [Aeriscardovia sp.]